MHIASIGIDLGKTTFHLVALGERNKSRGLAANTINQQLAAFRRRAQFPTLASF